MSDQAPLYKLFSNPIFRRYAVPRLRPLPLVLLVLLVNILASGVYFLGFVSYLRLNCGLDYWWWWGEGGAAFKSIIQMHGAAAGAFGWLAILGLQFLILYFKGTFMVAVGMAREATEGMVDLQRLTPLPTWHKVVGQLFGFPIQEFVLTLSMSLWIIPTLIFGGLSFVFLLQAYFLFFLGAVLHHALGLVAGSLIKQKVLAGTISQALVIVLHVVFPFVALVGGVGGVGHLGALGMIAGKFALELKQIEPSLSFLDVINESDLSFQFMGLSISSYTYSVLLSLIFIGFLVFIVWRHWQHEAGQVLGKVGSVVGVGILMFFSWVEFGWVAGDVDFVKNTFKFDRSREGQELSNHEIYLLLRFSAMLMILPCINLIFASGLVSSQLQRRLYAYSKRKRFWDDGALEIPWVVAQTFIVICTLYSMTLFDLGELVEAFEAIGWGWLLSGLAILVPVLTWVLLVRRLGWRLAGGIGILLSVLPPLFAAIVLTQVAVNLGDFTMPCGVITWLCCMSPFLLPIFAFLTDNWSVYSSSLFFPVISSLVFYATIAGWAWFSWRRGGKI